MAREQQELTENLTILPVDDQYRQLVKTILARGQEKSDPQGVGNLSINGYHLQYDLSTGRFPLLGLRDLGGSWKTIVGELLWFIKGSTNTVDLHKEGIHLWDVWADATQKDFDYPPGELGPIYGKQWRAFDGGGPEPVDQLIENMRLLKTNPDSRRIAVSAWNPYQINRVFVSPCIRYFQFHHAQNELGLSFVQGSADVAVGVPFDTAEYALLLLMAAKVNNMQPKILNHFIVDGHIYKDQIPKMQELVERKTSREPSVVIHSQPDSILDYKREDFELTGYEPSEKMKIPVAL